jgi:hypothetical protein
MKGATDEITGGGPRQDTFRTARYLDEQAFRYNNRQEMNDSQRFDLVVSQIFGKRLTFKELTGKTGEAAPEPF